MAYASLTSGAWGVFHWIYRVSPEPIRANVQRLYAELRQLIPPLNRSWSDPPFEAHHAYKSITRDWLTDRVTDITTLALEDNAHYYLIAVDNSGVFEDVTFRMALPNMIGTSPRQPTVLNEGWPTGNRANRMVSYNSEDGTWLVPEHTMVFGDVNIWVIPKEAM